MPTKQGIASHEKIHEKKKGEKIMWFHFSFTSGCNPFIATNEKTAKNAIRKFRRHGFRVEKIQQGFYLVHDTRTNESF